MLAVMASVAVIVGIGANAALAGEVKGPPGTPGERFSGSGQPTAAEDNANSICAFSGLNDMNPEPGQIDRQTQTEGCCARVGGLRLGGRARRDPHLQPERAVNPHG
jgi:hypothetical protein